MSNIYQNQMGSVKYNFSIKCRIGNQELRSTLGTKSKIKAQRLQDKVNDLEIDARLNPHRVEDYVARFWILMGRDDQYRKQQDRNNPIFLDLYRSHYKGKLRDEVITSRTYELYKDFDKNIVSLFELHKIKDLRLQQFNQEVLDSLMQFFSDQEYSATTKNMRLRLLRCFLNWCVDRNYISSLPFKIVKVKEPHKKPSFLYPDQFQAILNQTTSIMRAYFRIYKETGLRRSEMFNCKEVVRSNGTWLVVQGKGNKERVVAIPEGVSDDWQLVKENPVKPHSITRAFNRACKGAGLVARLHDLRHTFAFTQVASGVDPFTLQMKMGHSDFKTTQVYLQTDRDMLIDLIDDQNKLLDASSGIA
tara:strand:+ start:1125 stop:2207 length:1083 start_codon:yes stop_codon:yes gene_type:complete